MPYLSYINDYNDNLLMLLMCDYKRYMSIVEFMDNLTQQLSELSWKS